MAGERRVTRSSKDAPPTNGTSKSGSGKKETPPAKPTAAKGKAPVKEAPKKGVPGKEAPAKANGVNGNKSTQQDIEMAEDVLKNRKDDDEMTVVVPPPKGGKLAGEDGDDEEMEGVEVPEDVKESGPTPKESTFTGIKDNFALLERAVTQFDPRFTLRVLRSISTHRKHLDADILAEVVTSIYTQSSDVARTVLAVIGKSDASFDKAANEMDVDGGKTKAATPKETLPEIDVYIWLLTLVLLHDKSAWERGAKFSETVVDGLRTMNRRTLDALSAKVYFYYALFHEQLKPLPPSTQSPVIAVRPKLLAALRTAVLRKDSDTQATVTTLLLRNYLSTSHITQADLLISHSQFPPAAPNNQIARYLYYLGRIRAIQLQYTEAHDHLVGATRKAPSTHSAGGFYQASHKLLIVVELLMGDIPDRAVFRQASLERALKPYLQLVQAVRVGRLEDFTATLKTYADVFKRDGTYTLTARLRQNVIKTGIRMMSLSYSRISLRDICMRLGLPSEETAEYIVAKAIRDGVIEASLDHEHGFMKSKESGDIYATREPGEAFHERIRACLDLHDESVKAMRFPMNQHRQELRNAQEARERERELAKEIVEGDLDDDDAGGDFEGM